MSTAFFDSHGLDDRLSNELFDRASRVQQLPVAAARGAGVALSALLPDLALLMGGAAALVVAGSLVLLPAGVWQPAMLITQALVLLVLGVAGSSSRWLVAATGNLMLTAVATYGLMAGSVALTEIVLWQAVMAGIAFTDARRVPGWRQGLAAQLVWLLVISLSL